MPAPSLLSRATLLLLVHLGLVSALSAAPYEPKPEDPYFRRFNPRQAPAPGPLYLERGDRLAIVGDSITEQKKYSRIIETYLAACRPDLAIEVRQLGWSGETVEGFRRRVASDCLRFQPDVVTLCYGMNDSKYRPYDDLNGQWFRDHLTSLVAELTAAEARVVVGSPGIAERAAVWIANRAGTLSEHNLHLCTLRDIALDVADRSGVRFADVFWPMLQAGFTARARYNADPEQPYALAGKDGIHPDWAGQLIMAYAFLRGLGLDGAIGTISVNLADGTASASAGHRVEAFDGQTLTLVSERYPFCADGPVDRDDSIRSGMSLIPFNQELNRFVLKVTGQPGSGYRIRWGDEIRLFTAAQMEQGVNLAEEFAVNPFSEPFAAVDAAVAAKQQFETVQVKQRMHGPEGQQDLEGTVARTEAERAELLARIRAAVVPVTHTIEIHRR